MKKLRVGIIGNGGISQLHAGAYMMEEDRVEVVALCDIILERAEMLQDNCFEEAEVYEDYKELLKDESIDAVDICTPNHLHSTIAIAAFEAGKHVFCEKPDAINVEEVEKMKLASEKAGKLLMVMRNNRFISISQHAKKLAEDGKLGEIYAGRCGWIRRRGIPGKGGWFTTKALSGGGPLIDLGVHMIDLAIWLMGNPTPVAVSGATYCKFADSDASDSENTKFGDKIKDGTFDVEDLAMGFIRFDNGAVLQIECSWASNIEEETRFVELRGTKGGINWSPDQLKIFTEKKEKQLTDIVESSTVSGGHGENISHFIDVLTGVSDTPCFEPQQGIDMIKILSAIYESAETGKEVRLS